MRSKFKEYHVLRPPQKLDRGRLEFRHLLQPSCGRFFGKFSGRQISQRTVRPVLFIIKSPSLNFLPGIMEGQKHVCVDTPVSEPSVETLNRRILHGFAGRMKSSLTPCTYAQASSAFEANPLPLSTVIICQASGSRHQAHVFQPWGRELGSGLALCMPSHAFLSGQL